MYTSHSNFVCGVIEPGFASTCPRSTSSRFVPRSRMPTLSPACTWSRSFRNISVPVQTVFCVGLRPTISSSSPTLHTPRSTRPVRRPLRGRDVAIQRVGELHDRLLAQLARVALERLQGRTDHDRGLVPGK